MTVFTRHTADCPKAADRYWKRCNCRKSLYIYEGGKVSNISARTRSWEQAERFAQTERDKRDPVKVRLREIEAEEAQKKAFLKATSITVPDAVDRWLLSLTKESTKTDIVRNRVAWRIKAWAEDQGIETVREITPDALDLWRGKWARDAEERYNRIGQTTSAHFQSRLKGFFVWCLTVINMRGVHDTGVAFMISTYLFTGTLLVVIAVGGWHVLHSGGHPHPVTALPPLPAATTTVSLWLLLKVFSSGCTAMTGVEAVSNGVMAFRDDTRKNAKITLTIIIVLLAVLLAGIALLCRAYDVAATNPDGPGYESVLSMLTSAVMGHGAFYYLTIGSVLLVLALSANTAFADFPRLTRVVV